MPQAAAVPKLSLSPGPCCHQPRTGGSGSSPQTPPAQSSSPMGRDDALERASPSQGWMEPCECPGCAVTVPAPAVCSSSAAPHDGDKGDGPPKTHPGQLGKQLARSWRAQPCAKQRSRLFTEYIKPRLQPLVGH